MTVVWSEDFESYPVGSNTITTPWVNTGPAGPTHPDSLISDTIFHGGSKSLGVGAGGGSALGAGWVIRTFGSSLNVVVVDAWIYMPSGTTAPDPPQSNAPGFRLQNSGSGGNLVFYMGGNGTCYASEDVGTPSVLNAWFAFSLSLNAWHHIVWATTLGVSGTSTMVVDGGPTMTFSGDTRTNGGDTTVDEINVRGQFVVGSPIAEFYIDDLIISNSVSPPPAANTLQAQATPNAGNTDGGGVGIGRWRGSTGLNWYGMALVGDAFSGVLGLSDFDVFTEYGNTMRFLITTPPIHEDRKRIFMDRFEIEVEAGDGVDGQPAADPQMMLEWSKDGGKTWYTSQPARSMGLLGQYIKRLRWINLGQSRTWIFRLTCTDPVRRYIIGAYTSSYKGLG